MFEFLYLFLVYNFIHNYWTLLSLFIIFKTGHYGPVIIVSVSLCFVASFLFKRSFFNFLFPEHPFYLMMNNFLLQRPALDIRDLPLFYSMFNSSTMQVKGSLSLNCTPLHEVLGKVSLLWESDDYIDLYWVPTHLIDPGQMLEPGSPMIGNNKSTWKMTESCMNILPSSRWNRTHGPPSSNWDALTPELLEALWRAGWKFNYNYTSHRGLHRGLARNQSSISV